MTSESQPFQPLPGQITEVAFNPPIPVHAITTVTGVYEYQAVALTATDANSVIPAGTASGHSSGAYYPAALPGQERNETMTSLGTSTQILFEADEELVDTSNATPARPLTVGSGRFAGNTATVPLVCKLTTLCTGALRLQSGGPATARTAATTTKTAAPKLYGSARFSIKAGKRAEIKIALNQLGRQLVRGHSLVTLYANATISGQVVSVKVKLTKSSHR